MGIDYALLPNCEWNQKNKNIKNSLGAMWNASHLAVRLCALRHWKRVSMPPTIQSLRHPLTRAFHIAPRIKTTRRFTAKNPVYTKGIPEPYLWIAFGSTIAILGSGAGRRLRNCSLHRCSATVRMLQDIGSDFPHSTCYRTITTIL